MAYTCMPISKMWWYRPNWYMYVFVILVVLGSLRSRDGCEVLRWVGYICLSVHKSRQSHKQRSQVQHIASQTEITGNRTLVWFAGKSLSHQEVDLVVISALFPLIAESKGMLLWLTALSNCVDLRCNKYSNKSQGSQLTNLHITSWSCLRVVFVCS